MLTEEIGMRWPTLRLASLLFWVNTEGEDRVRTSDTLSSACTMAAALLPRKVQVSRLPKSPCGATLPEWLPQLLRPVGNGNPASSATALSKNQLTPYCSAPVSATLTTCASMCTCIGITSRRSITSRIDFHCAGLARTSSELVSSIADTPTSMPSTRRLTRPLPLRAPGRLAPSRPPDPPEPPEPIVAFEVLPLSSTLLSRISVDSRPGISDASSRPPPCAPPPNTSARRSARSRALMYFNS